MHTVFLSAVFIALIFWCGLGPVLLLLPAQDSARRVLLLPFAGLAAHILFSLTLARLDLTGHAISLVALVFFSALAIWGLRRHPLTGKELRQSAAPLYIAALGVLFIGAPLFLQGFEHYWGYANPDQAYLMPVLKWIYTHPIGVPPDYNLSASQYYRGIHENTVLAIFYVISTVAAITRTSPDFLFDVTQAGLLFLVPLSVFLFADALGLPRRTGLIAGACVACSSLVAYTFYLDSLAALSVIAVIPMAMALLISFGRDKLTGYAILFGAVAAAMYYNYLGAIGVLGVLSAAILLRLFIYRELPIKRLLIAPVLALGLIATVLTPFALSIFHLFMFETFSTRLAATAASADNAELLSIFDLSLTERGVPFFWGLKIPTVTASWPWNHEPSPYLFVAGCLCFCLLIVAFWPRVSGLADIYVWIAVAALLPTAAYAYRGVGYGVFKLIAWIYPIMATGLIAALCGLAKLMGRTRLARLQALPYLAIVAYAATNIGLSCRLGLDTRPYARGGSPQNAVNFSFDNISDTRKLVVPRYAGNVAVMVPDVVAQRWLSSFLAPGGARVFPELKLYTEDSTTRFNRTAPHEAYVLHDNSATLDITRPPIAPPVWSNSAFALSRFDQLSDALFLGLGWYRAEGAASGGMRWQRRFRWLRKRGEIFIWNPTPGTKCLIVAMTAGYGNPSAYRHVRFYLNGQKFDEVYFSAYSRILTKPFEAAGPWSQVELEVEEDAAPLPRPKPLWAARVPQDPRRLNVAVSDIELVDPDVLTLPPSMIDLAEEFEKPQAFVDGVYPDRWIGAEAHCSLRVPSGARGIEIAGMAPEAPGLSFPYVIDVTLSDRRIGSATIRGIGAFRQVIPLPDGDEAPVPGQVVRLGLKPGATFVPTGGDSRRLSVRLARIGFTR
jgi:hypothetical protein